MRDELLEFLQSLRSSGYSNHTIEAYRRDIGEFLERGLSLNDEGIRGHVRHLKEKGLSKRTLARKLSSLRSFARFLARRGKLPEGWLSPIRVRVGPAEFQSLSLEEVMEILDQDFGSNFKGKRDAAIVELLYSTGLRVSELSRLNVEDIRMESEFLVVRRGKRGKDRLVPVGKRARERLLYYLEELLPLKPTTG